MNKEISDYIIEKANELIAAPMSCEEARAAAKAWLLAVGTADEAEATAAFIAELEEDIEPIDGLIGFACSDDCRKYFSEAEAKALLAHSLERKAAGEKYCDCVACAACEAILSKKEYIM